MRKMRNQQLRNRSKLDEVVGLIMGNYVGELTFDVNCGFHKQ